MFAIANRSSLIAGFLDLTKLFALCAQAGKAACASGINVLSFNFMNLFSTKKLISFALVLVFIFLPYRQGQSQTGVLIPSTKSAPDASILSLQTMNVDLCIDNQTATVRVVQ